MSGRSPVAVLGAEFAEGYYREVVGPLLARELPGLRYAAGRLGSGSDVLGFDDPMSRDHDWGCRLTVLVDAASAAVVPAAHTALEKGLPAEYHGRPTRFPTTWDPAPGHKVEIATVDDFAASRLGVRGRTALDWLTMTGHSVLEVTAGPIFVDTTAELAPLREKLRWYPPEVELYVLGSAWDRIAQYLPMVGRTADTGQDLGSRLLSAGLARDLMRLAFLTARAWAAYPKWVETAFRRLPTASELSGPLRAAVTAEDWREREDALVAAAEILLTAQRVLGLPTPERGVTQFWDRPYRTVEAVATTLYDAIADPAVARLPRGIGSIEQWVDNATVLSDPRP